MNLPTSAPRVARSGRGAQSGFSLIELMVSLVLGLLVISAAGSLFLANRQVFASTETVNRIQENGRAAFEIMSRDVREAGSSPCFSLAAKSPINTLEGREGAWWTAFANGISGAVGSSNTSDSITLYMANRDNVRVTKHDNPSAVLDVTAMDQDLIDDINDNAPTMMVCNADVAVIFQATGTTGNGLGVLHNTGDQNCGQFFPGPKDANVSDYPCFMGAGGNPPAHGYCFTVPDGASSSECKDQGLSVANVTRIHAISWHVDKTSKQLIRSELIPNAAGTSAVARSGGTVAVAEGASEMSVTYKAADSNAFVSANQVADWRRVTAVRVELVLEAADGSMSDRDRRGVDGEMLERTLVNVITIRNREGVL
ncbi:MAG: prepilin-type N-terminal cleavage/methylation domain-containing protein [Pseudoxanthomonas suwonensis]|nr:prepilin-type N-terminal cleavage/methylation domain-containing protein [Pseudoxanthomonas suwonensis]